MLQCDLLLQAQHVTPDDIHSMSQPPFTHHLGGSDCAIT